MDCTTELEKTIDVATQAVEALRAVDRRCYEAGEIIPRIEESLIVLLHGAAVATDAVEAAIIEAREVAAENAALDALLAGGEH